MCGIVGYIGQREAPQIIFDGLKRLEYRGYDSAGIAVLNPGGEFAVRRDAGKLSNLGALLEESPIQGKIGIGHTRWATHGAPTRYNSHPHTSMNGRVVLVHNGIVENFQELRDELEAEGVIFKSDTDTETVVHLIEKLMEAGNEFETATRLALARMRGASAIVVMNRDQPDRIITARLGNAGGITLGVGENEMFVASDIPAILAHTRQMVFLESRQMAIVTKDAYKIMSLDGDPLDSEIHLIAWDAEAAAKGEFQHFMQKEIFEQPRALIDTMRGRVNHESGTITLPEMNLTPRLAKRLQKMFLVACGTSHYSTLVGKYYFEQIARFPAEVGIGSEFRYAQPIVDARTAVLTITQSGETADTLAAAENARQEGALLWSIVNAYGSQSMRLSDGYIAMQAGPEIGVASTKAFTTSLVDQYMLAVELGRLRGVLSDEQVKQYVQDLALLPNMAGQVLDQNAYFKELAEVYVDAYNFLFLGRGLNYPIAMEGALKLKEISYIHAEGYPAGEMKHGPIALIDENMPVVALATQDRWYEKMVSNVQQAKARNGRVIVVATEGDTTIAKEADHVIYVPHAPAFLAPIVNTFPMQLLAYHIAVLRGCDVDQPRNLAKSVTVE